MFCEPILYLIFALEPVSVKQGDLGVMTGFVLRRDFVCTSHGRRLLDGVHLGGWRYQHGQVLIPRTYYLGKQRFVLCLSRIIVVIGRFARLACGRILPRD